MISNFLDIFDRASWEYQIRLNLCSMLVFFVRSARKAEIPIVNKKTVRLTLLTNNRVVVLYSSALAVGGGLTLPLASHTNNFRLFELFSLLSVSSAQQTRLMSRRATVVA